MSDVERLREAVERHEMVAAELRVMPGYRPSLYQQQTNTLAHAAQVLLDLWPALEGFFGLDGNDEHPMGCARYDGWTCNCGLDALLTELALARAALALAGEGGGGK